MKKTFDVLSAIFNFAIFALFVYALLGHYFFFTGSSNTQVSSEMLAHWGDRMRPGLYMYFTTDSNLIAALFSLILGVFKIRSIRTGTPVPTAAYILKFIGTCAVTLTLLTVVLFLTPVFGSQGMYDNSNFFWHLLCPILSILSFVLFDGGNIKWRFALLGAVPTVIYGVFYLVFVVALDIMVDFYGFNYGGNWAYSTVGMLAGSIIICYVLLLIQKALKRILFKNLT